METVYYSICYYYERMQFNNIKTHLEAFHSIANFEKEFILTVMTDKIEDYSNIEREMNLYLKVNTSCKYKVILSYNWGGTILGLWLSYNYIKSTNTSNPYLAFFEEDFKPTNENWLIDSVQLFSSDDFIYVGESNIGRVKYGDDDGRLNSEMHKHLPKLAEFETWTDGGYYFSSIYKLNMAEEHIGIFHKGSPESKYNRLIDGISYGEVGFPSLLHKSGFKFTALNRHDYFIHG